MPKEDNKVLNYNHGETFMKVPLIIYAGLEALLEKMNRCHSNPKKSSATKIIKHTASGYSLLTYCSFDMIKNKLDYYRGKNCIKNFCLDIKEHATELINYEIKEMTPLTNEEKKLHRKQKVCYIYKKEFTANGESRAEQLLMI